MTSDADRDRGSSQTSPVGQRDPALAITEGWRSLDESPEDGADVEGLLASGAVVDAEWWGPVPEELWDSTNWDGSGWAWSAGGLPSWGAGEELIAWRLRDGTGGDPSPTGQLRDEQKDPPPTPDRGEG